MAVSLEPLGRLFGSRFLGSRGSELLFSLDSRGLTIFLQVGHHTTIARAASLAWDLKEGARLGVGNVNVASRDAWIVAGTVGRDIFTVTPAERRLRALIVLLLDMTTALIN